MFADLHRVELTGFGPLGIDGHGQFSRWSEWLRHQFRSAARVLTEAGYPTLMACIDHELERWTPALDQRPARLVHGDLGDGEIFIGANGDVRGIVDWGGALAADPLYEFARFVAGGPADDPRPPPSASAARTDRPLPPSGRRPGLRESLATSRPLPRRERPQQRGLGDSIRLRFMGPRPTQTSHRAMAHRSGPFAQIVSEMTTVDSVAVTADDLAQAVCAAFRLSTSRRMVRLGDGARCVASRHVARH